MPPDADAPDRRGGIALVMSGGGARGAYQVGLVRGIASFLPEARFTILTGVSAGAINAAYYGAHTRPFARKAEELAQHWSALTVEQVFEARTFALLGRALRVTLGLASGGSSGAPRPRALVDTTPLDALLKRLLETQDGSLPGIEANLASGELEAIAITAASYTSGRSVTWVEGRRLEPWRRAHRIARPARLSVAHVMASAALPIFFPAVSIDGRWFGDGGMRLTDPLSPAVHLGAERILAISTRFARPLSEEERQPEYPPPAQVLGNVFNAIFLDQFDADALRLQRINDLVGMLPGGSANGLRRVELCVVRPSLDLGRLANDYEAALPRPFRFLLRGLGTKEVRSNDLLSLVMFQPDYLQALIALGERDAREREDEIRAFLGAGARVAARAASREGAHRGAHDGAHDGDRPLQGSGGAG